MIRHIPNFITSLNLASGLIAIIFIFRGDPVIASWLILLAMVFDFSDGFASRLLKAYSDLGKELDSLADMVSFGVTPGLIIYYLLNVSIKSVATASDISNVIYIVSGYMVPALFVICAALRLAKFNIDTSQTTSFKGLPTPAAALAVVSVLLASVNSDSAILNIFLASPAMLILFSLIVSGLMVSRIPLLSLKFHTWGFKGNEGRYVLLVICLFIVLTLQWEGIPLIVPAYIIVSLFLRN